MKGWMTRWMIEWMGCMQDGCIGRSIDGWINGCIDGYNHGRTDETVYLILDIPIGS